MIFEKFLFKFPFLRTEVLNKCHVSLQMGNCPIPVAEHSGPCEIKRVLVDLYGSSSNSNNDIMYHFVQQISLGHEPLCFRLEASLEEEKSRLTLTPIFVNFPSQTSRYVRWLVSCSKPFICIDGVLSALCVKPRLQKHSPAAFEPRFAGGYVKFGWRKLALCKIIFQFLNT